MGLVTLQLRSGVIGYYEPKSNVHLTIDNKQKTIDTDLVDCSGLVAAYKNQGSSCPFVVVSGSFDNIFQEASEDVSTKKVEIGKEEEKPKEPQVAEIKAEANESVSVKPKSSKRKK